MTKTGTFTLAGYAAARRPDGSFLPSVPLYVDSEAAGPDLTSRLSQALQKLFAAENGQTATGGAA